MTKRDREIDDTKNITAMANYLMLLSGVEQVEPRSDSSTTANRVFTCKTCDRQFTSFQALGGHRASHKKPRLAVIGGDHVMQQPPSPPKPKTHECSVCGLEFPIGQALGGHMRRHRASVVGGGDRFLPGSQARVVKKLMTNNNTRVLCLDLNLTPLENKFVFGKINDSVCW